MNERPKLPLMCRIFGHKFDAGRVDRLLYRPGEGVFEIRSRLTWPFCNRCGEPNQNHGRDIGEPGGSVTTSAE